VATGPLGRTGRAQTAPPPAPAVVRLAPEFLRDPKNIEQGRGVWKTRCQFCHGKAAYPGKAPKLDPSRYTAEFVYDRVTNGFKGMPGWRQEFSEQELRAVVAYVLSKDFSN
jgi:mono/diheme cytochrome c family protein